MDNTNNSNTQEKSSIHNIADMFMANVNVFSMIAVIFGVALVGLVLSYIGLFGKVSVYDYKPSLPGAESFTSLNKTDGKLELGGFILKNKSTRFSLNNQNNLQYIRVQLGFKPGQKEIKFGVRSFESEPFAYKTVYFEPINDLKWEKVNDDKLVLYQKVKQYDSVGSFLSQIPVGKKIGVYQIETSQLVPYIFPNVKEGNTKIGVQLRGNISMDILTTSGDLNINVNKQDINMYEGADSLQMVLSLDGAKVGEATIADDEITDTSKVQKPVQSGSIFIPNAKPGVYKLDLISDSPGSDYVISGIEINKEKVIFEGNVLIWGNQPTTFYTNDKQITTSTSWTYSIQELVVNDKTNFSIAKTGEKYTFDLNNVATNSSRANMYKVFSPKGDINFGTASNFTFAPEAYFDPKLINAKKLTANDTVADMQKELDYVITTVSSPLQMIDGWIVSDFVLKAEDYQLVGNNIYFSLEIPDLDKNGGSLEINELGVTLVSY